MENTTNRAAARQAAIESAASKSVAAITAAVPALNALHEQDRHYLARQIMWELHDVWWDGHRAGIVRAFEEVPR